MFDSAGLPRPLSQCVTRRTALRWGGQAALGTRLRDLLAGAGGNNFGDGIRFTPPRRMFLGVRLNF